MQSFNASASLDIHLTHVFVSSVSLIKTVPYIYLIKNTPLCLPPHSPLKTGSADQFHQARILHWVRYPQIVAETDRI